MEKVYIPTPHRQFSDSEVRELGSLIKDYVDANPHASKIEITEGIILLGEMYDQALQLRYNVKPPTVVG